MNIGTMNAQIIVALIRSVVELDCLPPLFPLFFAAQKKSYAPNTHATTIIRVICPVLIRSSFRMPAILDELPHSDPFLFPDAYHCYSLGYYTSVFIHDNAAALLCASVSVSSEV